MKVLIGTKNKGKIARFANYLNDLGIEFETPYTIHELENLAISENGSTTEENAIIKGKNFDSDVIFLKYQEAIEGEKHE